MVYENFPTTLTMINPLDDDVTNNRTYPFLILYIVRCYIIIQSQGMLSSVFFATVVAHLPFPMTILRSSLFPK